MKTFNNGKEFERYFFGLGEQEWKTERRYLSYAESILRIRSIQNRYGWNPEEPTEGTLAAELFENVQKNLRDDYRKWLRLYITLDTYLDWEWGTDGIFELVKPSKKVHVAIDVTLQKYKQWNAGKADYFIYVGLVSSSPTKEIYLGELGRRIASRLNQKMNTSLYSWRDLERLTIPARS